MDKYTSESGGCLPLSGRARTSNDFTASTQKSEADCYRLCDKDPGCFAFHWNNDLKACGFWKASDGVKGNGKKDAWTCRIKSKDNAECFIEQKLKDVKATWKQYKSSF